MPIDWLVLGAAALTGLLGGVHCAAMCGGIAIGFSPGRQLSLWQASLPNLGRILGYTVAGAGVGLLGHALLSIARTPWLALGLRMAVGGVLVLAAMRLLGVRGMPGFLGSTANRTWSWLRPLQARLLPADTDAKRLLLGVLWGWLPCGLSTSVLLVAWLQGQPLHSAATMLAFGLGTLVTMLPITWVGTRIAHRLQRGNARKAAAGLVLAAGVLTIAAPWLAAVPAIHGVLSALGCATLPPASA